MVDVVRALGGVAPWGILVRVTSRAQVQDAILEGRILRIGRGRYALPDAYDALVLATRASGHVCLTTAALAHAWAVKSVPRKPWVALPKHRRLSPELAEKLSPHWIDLAEQDTMGACTSEVKTIEMCLRSLPFDEALVIADSALRTGFPRATLLATTESARGPGSAQMRRVAHLASGKAANPFESVLRAICLGVEGLDVRPQLRVRTVLGTWVRPDLVDDALRIVAEADSFEWHGDRVALRRDARRYDELVASGWAVLRFAWEDVMHEPEWVRQILTETVAVRRTDRRTA